MGKTIITHMTCDGAKCGKVLEIASDGIFIEGNLFTPESPQKLIVKAPHDGLSYCWTCFRDLFPKAPRPPPPPPESTYHGEDGYDPYPRCGPKAPTGPLPPPELPGDAPHYVQIAANLSGVRR